MTLDAAGKLIERLGLPLAFVVGLGIALVRVLAYVAKLMEDHRKEREQFASAHLASLALLGDKLVTNAVALGSLGQSVRELKEETSRALDRIEMRVQAAASRGFVRLDVLAWLAFAFLLFAAALLASGCSGPRREMVNVETHSAERAEAAATSEAHDEQRTEASETVERARQVEPTREILDATIRTIELNDAGKPARIIRARIRRRQESGAERETETRKAETTTAASASSIGTLNTAKATDAAQKLRAEKRVDPWWMAILRAVGFPLAICAVVLLAMRAWRAIETAGGPLKAIVFLWRRWRLFRRL